MLTAVLVPVGMGYAAASGLPAIYGLYATIFPLIAYAIFGPSKILVLGPDSALAGLIAATILPLAAGNADKAVVLAGMLAIITGVLCIVAGLARFGFITDLLSKPIREGYLNGIALTVLIGQLPKVLGFSVSGSNFLQETKNLMQGIWNGQINWTACAIGISCLIVILGFKRWASRIPGVLIAVVGATIIASLLDLSTNDGNRRGWAAAAGFASIPNPCRFVRRIQRLVCCRSGNLTGVLCRYERTVAHLCPASRP